MSIVERYAKLFPAYSLLVSNQMNEHDSIVYTQDGRLYTSISGKKYIFVFEKADVGKNTVAPPEIPGIVILSVRSTEIAEMEGKIVELFYINDLAPPVTFQTIMSQSPNGTKVMSTIKSRIEIFNDLTPNLSVAQIVEDVQKLLKDCHLIVQKYASEESIAQLLTEHEVNFDWLFERIESFIMHETYDITFYKLCQEHKEDDRKCLEITIDCSLAVLEDFDVYNATQIFKTIESQRTPGDKLATILRTITSIAPDGTSADAVLPLFITILIKCNTATLTSNLQYIKLFSFEKDVSMGRVGYAVSTLEAAIEYILGNRESLVTNSKMFFNIQEAIKDNRWQDLEPQRELLARFRDSRNNSALTLAFELGKYEVGYKLLRVLNIAHKNCLGDTVLHLAAKNNAQDAINYVLRYCTALEIKQLSKPNMQGLSPLLIAISNDFIDLCIELYHKIPPVHFGDISLIFAFIGSTKTLNCIFEVLEIKNIPWTRKAITQIIAKKPKDIMNAFLEDHWSWVAVDSKDFNGKSIVHRLVETNNFEGLELLLRHSDAKKILDIMALQDFEGNSPLHDAIASGNLEISKMLLNKGADLMARNSSFQTPLEMTLNESIIEELIEYYVMSTMADFVCVSKDKEPAVYTVYCCQYKPKTNLQCTITKRTIEDFVFLNSQLLMMKPEAWLPKLKDNLTNPLTNDSSNTTLHILSHLGNGY